MGALTAALMGLSAVSSFAGSRRAASGAEAQGAYEGAALDMNASLADQQAHDAIARGAIAEKQQRETVKGVIGAQRTGFAGQGVDVSSGSAVDVQGDTSRLGELDAQQIRANAAREAYGFSVQALNYRQQASLARLGAKNTAASLRNQGIGTLLTAGANLYAMKKRT